MASEQKGLLERVAGAAEKALHKLEELVPAAVAGPVHAVAEAAAGLLPHHHPAETQKAAPVATPPVQEPAKAAPVRAAPPLRMSSAPAEQVAPTRKRAPVHTGFKVKRGQKH